MFNLFVTNIFESLSKILQDIAKWIGGDVEKQRKICTVYEIKIFPD